MQPSTDYEQRLEKVNKIEEEIENVYFLVVIQWTYVRSMDLWLVIVIWVIDIWKKNCLEVPVLEWWSGRPAHATSFGEPDNFIQTRNSLLGVLWLEDVDANSNESSSHAIDSPRPIELLLHFPLKELLQRL